MGLLFGWLVLVEDDGDAEGAGTDPGEHGTGLVVGGTPSHDAICTSQEIRKSLLPTLGAPPSTSKPARGQDARRDDVVGHRAAIIKQRAKAEGRQRAWRRVGPCRPQKWRAVPFHMQRPETFGLDLQPIDRP